LGEDIFCEFSNICRMLMWYVWLIGWHSTGPVRTIDEIVGENPALQEELEKKNFANAKARDKGVKSSVDS